MIPLKDIFSLLASGEFSNIGIVKDRHGNIDEAEYGKIIGHINLALIEIYKRFKFLENEIALHAHPTVKTYYLRPEYIGTTGNLTLTRYLERPQDGDGSINIIEIKDIFDETQQKVLLNNRFSIPSIKLKSNDTLRIEGLDKPEKFSIVYQAHPTTIVLNDDFDINQYRLDIPPTIVEALLYYVAARVYKPIGANNSTEAADKSASYQHQYELSCQKLDFYGLATDDNDDDQSKFYRQGWV